MDTEEDLSFEQLFEESLTDGKIQIGEVAKGRVIQITSDFVVVDVGFKSEGQIPVSEFMDHEHNLFQKIPLEALTRSAVRYSHLAVDQGGSVYLTSKREDRIVRVF